MDEQTSILIEKLKQIGVLSYGSFILKSGVCSNYYCDFRILISYPNLISAIYELIPQSIFEGIDLVCGVYFGGLPLANLISFKRNIPQIFIRDSEKKHGTKKQIEGNYHAGQTVLLIEDVITTGGSVLEKAHILETYGIKVVILTILNRNDVSVDDRLFNYQVHSILPLNKIINENVNVASLRKIYNIAFKKQSNIILSVDLNKSEDIIKLIENTKEYIVGIKIHSDIIDDFQVLLSYLKSMQLDDFIIIEDCKVADISFISIQKVKNYASYANYITYHCLLGSDLPISLKNEYPDLGLLGIIEMSAKNCLIDNIYMKQTEPQLHLMDGCIIQKNGIQLFSKKLPVTFSPGISISSVNDNHNQTYKNPLKEKVGEFWIIGRSIYLASDTKTETKKYRDIGWTSFLNYHVNASSL